MIKRVEKSTLLEKFMKQLLLASALLHTFSVNTVEIQPRNAVASNTVSFECNYKSYATVQGTGTSTYIIDEATATYGIIDIELYRVQDYFQDQFGNDNRMYIYGKITHGQWTTNEGITELEILQWFQAYTGYENVGYQVQWGEGLESQFLLVKSANAQNLDNVSLGIGQHEDLTASTQFSKSIYLDNSITYPYYFYIGIEQEDHFYDFNIKGTEIRYSYTYDTNDNGTVDLAGLLWEILAMPFGFISTAFNLTLWPYTAYALNVGELLTALVSALIVIFIIRRFTR